MTTLVSIVNIFPNYSENKNNAIAGVVFLQEVAVVEKHAKKKKLEQKREKNK